MACYRAAIGGVARSGGNRNWGKLDWIVEEKDRCGFVSCLFWMSHRAESKEEHRFWRSSRWLIIPFRYAERICLSQYFRKQVFCSTVWSSVRAIFQWSGWRRSRTFHVCYYEGDEGEIADWFDVSVFFLFRCFFVFDGLFVVHQFHTVWWLFVM